MQIGNILGSRKARQTMAAVVALGVVQIPLISLADAPAPWVQKAEQKKKKKKAARKASRRPVQRTETVTRAPEVPAEVVQAPPPVEAPPPAIVEAPVPVTPPAPVAPPPAAPVPAAAVATGSGFNWLFPVLGLVGLGGLVAALGSSSNG